MPEHDAGFSSTYQADAKLIKKNDIKAGLAHNGQMSLLKICEIDDNDGKNLNISKF